MENDFYQSLGKQTPNPPKSNTEKVDKVLLRKLQRLLSAIAWANNIASQAWGFQLCAPSLHNKSIKIVDHNVSDQKSI